MQTNKLNPDTKPFSMILRTVKLIALLLFISTSIIAQQAMQKTLLWRISGRGLTKPSYLYGTMHLNDKRLFNFGDSVYHSIEQSEGFAIELNPDELGAYYVNKLFDQLQKSKRLKDILNDADIKKYSAALAKKFNKPADDITANDIVKEKNKWMADYMEKGEMPTFMDAYLYNIARRQGKWVGGIEDMADQAGLMEDLVDKSDIRYLLMSDSASNSKEMNKGLEHMISLYTSGDINGIEAMSEGGNSMEKKDRILITRNIKMARRIDSLINLRTMFVAIGAAHLPGDTGVIDLLRKRGFVVTPVISSRRIEEKDYTFKEVPLPWYPVEDAQGLYKTSMPGNPASIKVFGLVEMKFLMDITNMAGYCSMAVASAGDFKDKDSTLNELAKRMLQTEKLTPAKIIYKGDIEGREYQQEKKGANLRLQLFIYKKIIYVSFMTALKSAYLNTADADKFFNAMVINKNPALASSKHVFTDSIMGVSFVAPMAISYNEKMSSNNDNGWKISGFSGTDFSAGSYVLVFSKEVKPGHYIATDSVVYTDFVTALKQQYKLLQQEEKNIQGYRTLKITGQNILQPSLFGTALTFMKQGKSFLFMTITDSANLHSPAIDGIFESLQLIKQPSAKWQLYQPEEKQFSCWCPAPLNTYSSITNKQFYSYDTTTSITYSVIPDTLSKYFWSKNDSVFWADRITYNVGKDSLVQKKAIRNGNATGVELLVQEGQKNNRLKRMRLLLNGDKLYKLFVAAEKDFLEQENVNKFFNSFTFSDIGDTTFYVTPKTTLLLRDLTVGDSATRQKANDAIEGTSFTDSDRKLLQDAVFKTYYSSYDSSIATYINGRLITKLAGLNNRETIAFAKSQYNSFDTRKDTLKNMALSLLAQMHTKESYDAIGQLLQESVPRESFEYDFIGSLKDSLALTASIYPVLQKLAADTVQFDNIASIANTLVDSGFIKLDDVKKSEREFIKSTEQMLPALLHDNDYYLNIYPVIKLLGRFNSVAANKTLQKLLSVKSLWIKKEVAIELIKNKQSVSPAILTKLAADKSMRHDLYTSLKELKKQSLFPVKYLTRSYFAEAAVYNVASDDGDDEIAGIKFLYTRTKKYKNKSYIFYLYKVSFEAESTDEYLGIAGGYSIGNASLEPAEDISGVYNTKKLDSKNATELLEAYLADLDKPEENEIEE